MTASVVYEGDLRCEITHNQSRTIIETDAPTDNRGKGERFSPTDLVGVALGTCAITTMGMKAMDMGIDLRGTTIDIQKHMRPDPRRIARLDVVLKMPAGLELDDKSRTILENTGNNCPVAKSLSAELDMQLVYNW
ncbi:OsmC family protein [Flavihumibacter petaseus]|uniref:OsmC family protein n=1 Tax=Flavihumibacter petaseus NBRC 106054 TaxID=1220578 RepID=A0A0E9N5V1_9BACT|nr:OsmC family protein [Flavihumibacter petaseus]GAO45337.1 hypothetical protein FPE01S_05_00340 [Flavihumibacter petaseus NBRC 106054]